MSPDQYCREIEAYLCRKNDGHLIRVVGPSFDLVAGWASAGVPIKVAFSGIDRAFTRYHASRPRRRPLKIDFCDADVLDAFDAWRRNVGLAAAAAPGTDADAAAEGASRSLPAHLQRAIVRLTSARASGIVGEAFDPILDALGRELDVVRASPRGVRGAARQALLARLETLDRDLLDRALETLDAAARRALGDDAEADLSTFRDRMDGDAFARVRNAAIERLLRDRLQLPTIAFRA